MFYKNKTVIIGAALILVFAFQTYAFISMKRDFDHRMTTLKYELDNSNASSTAQISEISSLMETVTDRIGLNAKELEEARRSAQLLKEEQAKTAARLKNELATNAQAVTALRDEASTLLAEVQNETTEQFGLVNGEVQTVKLDLDAAKSDLAARLTDVRDTLGRQIAMNSSEVAQLRTLGERDFFEFNLAKEKTMTRIADIQVQLKKADTKGRKFDVVMLVDDEKVERKGQFINEPIPFLVGRDRLRYEFVVYGVEKDRIRGYVSTPKDKVLSAEGPAFR